MTIHLEHGAPAVIAVRMGYGHLRAGKAVADYLQVPLLRADAAPLAAPGEQLVWYAARVLYEGASRWTGAPVVGGVVARGLGRITVIPDATVGAAAPNGAARVLGALSRLGLGGRLVSTLAGAGAVLSTFYAPAVALGDRGRCHVFCVVTDSDVNRVWAGVEPRRSTVTYLCPTAGVEQRLRSWGVPVDRVQVTGFPLPDVLLGGPALATLTTNFERRRARLGAAGAGGDPQRAAPLLTFAVGGAGAQADTAVALLAELAPLLASGRLRLALVAGTRRQVARRLAAAVALAVAGGVPAAAVRVVAADDFPAYEVAFNRLLADTDLLWTKPSELVFFAALGLPLILDRPIGDQEVCNLRWALANRVASERPAGDLAAWVASGFGDGRFMAQAERGRELPAGGLFRIAARVAHPELTPA